MQIKIYTQRNSCENFTYKTQNKQIHYVNAQIHTEIIVNIYMQNRQEIPININIGINHK
jgi:hypothetical protein